MHTRLAIFLMLHKFLEARWKLFQVEEDAGFCSISFVLSKRINTQEEEEENIRNQWRITRETMLSPEEALKTTGKKAMDLAPSSKLFSSSNPNAKSKEEKRKEEEK